MISTELVDTIILLKGGCNGIKDALPNGVS